MDQSVRRFEPLAAICRAIAEGDIPRAAHLVEEQGPEGLVGTAGGHLGQSPVMLALSTGHPKLARRIVAAGYRPDLWESAGLDLEIDAALLGQSSRARLNLCNADGWAPLHLACYAHAHRALGALCELGADPDVLTCNNTLETPLHSAVRVDDDDAVRTLLGAGADARFLDWAGRTPLQLAIELASASAGHALAQHAE